jgi:peptidyl-prolyl cis-trans isomerase C
VKKDLTIALAAILIVLGAAWALAAARPDQPLTPSQPFVAGSHVAAGVKKVVGPNEKVVMHVNGEPITEREFYAFVEQAPEQARAFYASPAGRRALADELVRLKALEQEGVKQGMADDPAVRSQLDTVRAQIIAGRTLQKLMREGNDVRLRAEFEKEKGKVVDLRHIILAYQGSAVTPRGGGQAPTVEEAMQKANALALRIRGGESFASVAQSASDDQQSAARGGALGPVQLSELPPDVSGVITRLGPGQVSNPVRTQFGVHVFQASQPTFESMRPALMERMQRELLDETMKRLTDGAKVELDPKFFPEQRGPAPGQGLQPVSPSPAPSPQP